MKFGKKRSPEPDPIDITERLSILDLRPSVREGSATPIAQGIGAPQVVRPPAAASVAVAETPATETVVEGVESAVPAAPPVVAAPVVPEPVVPEPAVEPVAEAAPAPEPVHAEPAAPAYVEAVHAAPSELGAPDPLAYEMAAFELNLPPAAAAALVQPVPSEPVNLPEPEQQHEPVQHEPAASAPEPVVAAAPEPVEAPAPPAWSYEQVARIEHAEQHVSAWVPPQAQPQAEPEHAPEEAGAPAALADEPAIDLTEPSADPSVDLAEHDPVYAAVEASQNQSRDDEGVIRWHW